MLPSFVWYLKKKTKAAAFEVYVSLNSVILQSALIWYFCYHSSLATVRMGQISLYAYSTPWYQLSIDSQKSIQMMIQRSNCHFGYSGFGILQCNLQTLKMVCIAKSPPPISFLYSQLSEHFRWSIRWLRIIFS